MQHKLIYYSTDHSSPYMTIDLTTIIHSSFQREAANERSEVSNRGERSEPVDMRVGTDFQFCKVHIRSDTINHHFDHEKSIFEYFTRICQKSMITILRCHF